MHLRMAVDLVTEMNNNFAAVTFYFRSLLYCSKEEWDSALADIDQAVEKS